MSRLQITTSRSASWSTRPVRCSGECFQVFSDLQCYTIAKQDPAFIHQHVVDTYEAQHAGGPTRTITVAYGLIRLYLAVEKGYTGRQVQLAHMRIAKVRKVWPRLEPPGQPALLTVMDVLCSGPDADKDSNDQEMDDCCLGELGRPAWLGLYNNWRVAYLQ